MHQVQPRIDGLERPEQEQSNSREINITYVSPNTQFAEGERMLKEKEKEKFFTYWEEVVEVVKAYEEATGLPLKKLRSERDQFKAYSYVLFCCHYSMKSKSEARTHLCDCPFRLEVRRWLDSADPAKAGKYAFKVKCSSHNHDYTPAALGTLGPSRKFSLAAKQLVKNSPGLNGVQLATLIRENLGLRVTPKEISRIKEVISVPTLISDVDSAVLFMEEKNMVHDCLLTSHDSNIHEVSIMIFATIESIDAFKRFPQVLLLDSTYCTNFYDYPLLNFVGIDNYRAPFLVASALLYEETGICYDWVLTAFLSLLRIDAVEVKVILSDAELALRSAIRTMFPHSRALLCRWHLGLNLKKSMSKKGTDTETCSTACNLFHEVSRRTTKESFDEGIEELIRNYPSAREYIEKWCKSPDEWAEYMTKNLMKLGIDTTSQVEGTHKNLKRVLNNSTSSIKRLIEAQYNLITSQVDARNLADGLSVERKWPFMPEILVGLCGKITSYVMEILRSHCNTSFECNLLENGCYSVEDETVSTSIMSCSCSEFHSTSYPCIHIINVITATNSCLIPSDIHPRWHLPRSLQALQAVAIQGQPDLDQTTSQDLSRLLAPPVLTASTDSHLLCRFDQVIDQIKADFLSKTLSERSILLTRLQNVLSEPPPPSNSGPLQVVSNRAVTLRPKTTRRGRPKKVTRLKSNVEINEERASRGNVRRGRKSSK